MFEKKFFLLLLLAFGLFLVAACSGEDGDTYYIDEPLEIGEITLVETVAHNQRLKLVPSIKNATSETMYSWSATCGSFDDANSPAPMYIAPEKSGSCVITLEAVKGGKSTVKSDNVTIDTPIPSYPVMAKIDGLSGANLEKLGAGSVVFVANQGDGYRLYKLNAGSTDVTIDAAASPVIGDDVQLMAANSGSKIAVLTSGTGGTQRKILLYDGLSLSAPATPLGDYPVAATGFSPLPNGEAAFALTDDYLIVGSDNEIAGTFIEIYDLADTSKNVHIKSPPEIGELVSIAAQEVSGTTFLILGGTDGTKTYKIDTTTPLSIASLDAAPPDGKPSSWIKWNSGYALEAKANNAEVAVWKWETTGPVYKGSVYVPNGDDTSAVRAFQLGASDKAYVVSFNGGNVYEVDLAAVVDGNILPKKLIFAYPMHIGEGFTAWGIEKVTFGGIYYYVLTGGYYPSLGLDAPGVALIFKVEYPNIALGAVPEAAIYFSGLVGMLRTIDDGSGNYFYIAKDIGAAKFVVKKIG